MIFREHPDWHTRNRKLVSEIQIHRAVISTGAEGVYMQTGGLPIPMTRDEALDLATRIANQLENKK